MISQLEREEKFCTSEIQPQRGGVQVSTAGPGQYPASVEHLCLLHAAAREALETRRRPQSRAPALPRPAPPPAPPAPAPTPLPGTQADVRRAGWPSRAACAPSRRTLLRPSVLTSEVYVSTRGPFSLARRLLARKPPTRPSSAEKLSHPRPSWPLLLIHGWFFWLRCAACGVLVS